MKFVDYFEGGLDDEVVDLFKLFYVEFGFDFVGSYYFFEIKCFGKDFREDVDVFGYGWVSMFVKG